MKFQYLMVCGALAACSPPAPAPSQSSATPTSVAAPAPIDVPAGAYTLDKPHGSLLFRASHMGYSHFTGRFARWDAQLQFDPTHPEASSIAVTIDPRSIESDNPPAGFLNDLRGASWLDTAHFPEMSFRSTAIEATGANAARVTGDFSLHGITKPVTLDVTFNGGYPGMELDPHARIGFSAHGVFKRSDFGMGIGVPPPGSNMGVSDDVEVIIESEFTGPVWTPPAQPQTHQH